MFDVVTEKKELGFLFLYSGMRSPNGTCSSLVVRVRGILVRALGQPYRRSGSGLGAPELLILRNTLNLLYFLEQQ